MSAPAQLTSRLDEAIAHHKAGRLGRAEAIYRQLAAVAPRTVLVFELWAELAEQQGRLEEAVRLYTQACRLNGRSATNAVRLAAAHIARGRPKDAETVLRRLLQLAPESAGAWNALGFALKLQARMPQALACHEHAVAIDPRFVEGWTHLGLTHGVLGKNHLALQNFDQALALRPDYAPARYGRAQSLHRLYRTEEAIAEYDTYLTAEPRNLEARSYRLFALQSLGTLSRDELFAEHRAYGTAVGTGPDMPPGFDPAPEKRLRIAILSPDLRTHSCAYFLEPLIERLDPACFELYLYHDHFVEDAVSARLRKLAAVWRNFVGLPQETVERTIRADKPDILVDLSGHVGLTIRLPLFARRLAPVQVSYLGYPDTTGVPAMDFRFTDAIADPEGEADAYATEKLVRFAPVAWAYRPPEDSPPPAPPTTGRDGPVRFGCFNSPTKFNSTLLKTWARLLDAVPDSTLLLKGRDFEVASVRGQMHAWMCRCGLPADRVELVPRTAGIAEHLAQYARVDVALDTFPYNGTTTTCEALWMGRPVVTLRGNRHAARVGASLLTAVGHPEWVAADIDDYVRVARGLARDLEARACFASRAREELRRGALLDHDGQSRRFAAALRRCWQTRAMATRRETCAVAA